MLFNNVNEAIKYLDDWGEDILINKDMNFIDNLKFMFPNNPDLDYAIALKMIYELESQIDCENITREDSSGHIEFVKTLISRVPPLFMKKLLLITMICVQIELFEYINNNYTIKLESDDVHYLKENDFLSNICYDVTSSRLDDITKEKYYSFLELVLDSNIINTNSKDFIDMVARDLDWDDEKIRVAEIICNHITDKNMIIYFILKMFDNECPYKDVFKSMMEKI